MLLLLDDLTNDQGVAVGFFPGLPFGKELWRLRMLLFPYQIELHGKLVPSEGICPKGSKSQADSSSFPDGSMR